MANSLALDAAISAESAALEAAVTAIDLADRIDDAELTVSMVEKAVTAHLLAKTVVDTLS